MGVSGSFVTRLPIKRVLGDGVVGALGITSAAMAIYEELKMIDNGGYKVQKKGDRS